MNPRDINSSTGRYDPHIRIKECQSDDLLDAIISSLNKKQLSHVEKGIKK